MSAAIRCRHLHRQRGLPRLQGGSGAGRDSACCAGRLRPPPPWARSDSAAAVLRGRRPRARWARSGAFPQVARKAEARFGGFLADGALILGFNFTNVSAPAEGLGPTSPDSCTVFGFCCLLVWGYIADLSMVPRLRRGRLAGRALSHPFILRGQNFRAKMNLALSETLGRRPPQAEWLRDAELCKAARDEATKEAREASCWRRGELQRRGTTWKQEDSEPTRRRTLAHILNLAAALESLRKRLRHFMPNLQATRLRRFSFFSS